MGNGKGSSVIQVITTMQWVTGKEVPHVIAPRREGDAECVVANASKAFAELHWKPTLNLEDMCCSAWMWQSQNPEGYATNGISGKFIDLVSDIKEALWRLSE
jgi:UDP-glucose 4-epimerase